VVNDGLKPNPQREESLLAIDNIYVFMNNCTLCFFADWLTFSSYGNANEVITLLASQAFNYVLNQALPSIAIPFVWALIWRNNKASVFPKKQVSRVSDFWLHTGSLAFQ
jgi:hypothetical protein